MYGSSVDLFASGATHEIRLAVDVLVAAHDGNVTAVGLEFARLRVVVQIRFEQHVSQVMFRFWIGDWRHHFDAMLQVARHPVSTADIQLIVTAIREPENAAVLEKASDNTAHA